jgi:putative transposase
MSARDKDIEILALRQQLLVLQRQVGKPAFTDTDRAIDAGLTATASAIASRFSRRS